MHLSFFVLLILQINILLVNNTLDESYEFFQATKCCKNSGDQGQIACFLQYASYFVMWKMLWRLVSVQLKYKMKFIYKKIEILTLNET